VVPKPETLTNPPFSPTKRAGGLTEDVVRNSDGSTEAKLTAKGRRVIGARARELGITAEEYVNRALEEGMKAGVLPATLQE